MPEEVSGRQPEGGLQNRVGCSQQEGKGRQEGWEGTDISLGAAIGAGALGITKTARLTQSSWVLVVVRE